MQCWRCTGPLFLLVGTVLVGCLPATFVRTPAIRGRVLDADRKPVAGAVVRVRETSNGSSDVDQIMTDTEGRVSRAATSNWIIYFLSQDRWFPRYTLTASTGKSSSTPIEFKGGQVKPFGLGRSMVIDIHDLCISVTTPQPNSFP